jgi:hypothetical protein
LIALAATVEASSAHPLAKAVVAEAKRRKVPTSKPPASRPWQVEGRGKTVLYTLAEGPLLGAFAVGGITFISLPLNLHRLTAWRSIRHRRLRQGR